MNLAVITVARSDYGIYRPVLELLQADPDIDCSLFVSGMHLSPEFGMTVDVVKRDGYRIGAEVEMLLSADTPSSLSKSIGLGVISFAQVFAAQQPDMIMVLGDRFEMYSAVVAALPFNIPIIHIHGGEVTEGAIDEALRHSMTKMSHIHFVSTETYRNRVIQLGEEPWRVICSGAPGLDNLNRIEFLSRAELEKRVPISLERDPIVITYHSVTTEFQDTERQVDALLSAIEPYTDHPIVFTMPNADTGGRMIGAKIAEFADRFEHSCLVDNLGTQAYFSLMSIARVMVGNSSSGLIEAPSFKCPVVNIGNRQKGRVRGDNVIDVGYASDEIRAAIEVAMSAEFNEKLTTSVNPYGEGHASAVICAHLKRLQAEPNLGQKRFFDLPPIHLDA